METTRVAKTKKNVRQNYNESLQLFRAAAQKFRLAQHAYRAREIGDAEFLAARAEYDIADKASDLAYDELQAAYAQAAARGFIKDPVLEEIRCDKKGR